MVDQRTEVTIRPLSEPDIPEADRIMHLAFGTFLGLPDPLAFVGDDRECRLLGVRSPAPRRAGGTEPDHEHVGAGGAVSASTACRGANAASATAMLAELGRVTGAPAAR